MIQVKQAAIFKDKRTDAPVPQSHFKVLFLNSSMYHLVFTYIHLHTDATLRERAFI